MKWNVLWNTILTQWVWTEVETAWNSKSWWILALGHSHYALCFSDAGHSCGQRKEMSPAMDWTELVVLAVNVHSPLWGLLSLRWSAEVMDVELQYYSTHFKHHWVILKYLNYLKYSRVKRQKMYCAEYVFNFPTSSASCGLRSYHVESAEHTSFSFFKFLKLFWVRSAQFIYENPKQIWYVQLLINM